MSDADFKQDVERMFAEAERCQNLAQLGDALCGMVARNEAAFKDITHSYRFAASDTGTARAFALEDGRYRALDDNAKTDVTVTGTEKNLLAVFQRKISPAGALLFRRIKVSGSMTALMKLAEFL